MNQPKPPGTRQDGPFVSANVRHGLPGSDWTRDELSARVIWEYNRIEKGESYSPRYWFLGKFLLLVRIEFGTDLDAWKAWRVQSRLFNRTRCDRSMLLARAFRSPDDLQHVPVLEALALAAERLGLEARQTTADAKLRRSLASVKKTLADRLAEFGGVTKPDGLRSRIAELMRQLTALDHACVILERSRHAGPSKPPRAKGRK